MEHEFERRRLFLGGGPVWHSTWPPGRVEPNRRIYDYELVYVSSGKGRVATGERSYYCDAGSLVIIPPRLLHYSDAESGMERWCLHIDWFGMRAGISASSSPWRRTARADARRT